MTKHEQQTYNLIKKAVIFLKKALFEEELATPYIHNLNMAARNHEDYYNSTAKTIKEILKTHKAETIETREIFFKVKDTKRWDRISLGGDFIWKAFLFPGTVIPIMDQWSQATNKFMEMINKEFHFWKQTPTY